MRKARLILAGAYDTRGADVAANIARDRRYINYIRRLSADGGTGHSKLALEKRPGWSTTGTALTGTNAARPYGHAILRNSRHIGLGYVFANQNIFTNATVIEPVYGTTSLGTITPTHASFGVQQTEAQTSSGYYHLLSVNCLNGSTLASEAHFYQVTSATATGSLTKITDADLPATGIGPMTQKWGYAFWHDQSGNVSNSDLNDFTAWTAGSYFACNAVPDQGRGVWSHGDDLLAAFGANHIELLYNAGLTDLSPLKRVAGGVIEIGLVSAVSICDTGAGLAFLGKDRKSGAIGVFLLSGTSVQKISNATVDQYIATFINGPGTGHNTRFSAFNVLSEPTLMIQSSTDNGTTILMLACRLSDQFWYEWRTSATNPVNPLGVSLASGGFQTVCISGTNSTRYVYTMDDTTPAYTDGGNAFTATLQTGRTDFGSSSDKTLNWLELIGDTSGSGDEHVISLSTTDASSFTQIGVIDMSTRFRRLSSLGSFDDLSIKIEHSTATASRIEAIDVGISEWAH